MYIVCNILKIENVSKLLYVCGLNHNLVKNPGYTLVKHECRITVP